MSGAVRIAFVLVAAAAATIAANVVLLGVAAGRHDPVGLLSPPPVSVAPVRVSPPTRPALAPASRRHDRERRDD